MLCWGLLSSGLCGRLLSIIAIAPVLALCDRFSRCLALGLFGWLISIPCTALTLFKVPPSRPVRSFISLLAPILAASCSRESSHAPLSLSSVRIVSILNGPLLKPFPASMPSLQLSSIWFYRLAASQVSHAPRVPVSVRWWSVALVSPWVWQSAPSTPRTHAPVLPSGPPSLVLSRWVFTCAKWWPLAAAQYAPLVRSQCVPLKPRADLAIWYVGLPWSGRYTLVFIWSLQFILRWGLPSRARLVANLCDIYSSPLFSR